VASDVPAGAYSDAFLDHLTNPRGRGALDAPTHRGEAVDPACGDRLTVDLRVEAGVVAAARFRVEGCPAAIAVGSVVASLATGRAADAAAITPEEIERDVGGVPPGKRHALRLGVQAWQAAVRTRVP
jgi:NifU-like protein involved in Fe-S cluster formation